MTMTVQDLMEQLAMMDPDAPVYICLEQSMPAAFEATGLAVTEAQGEGDEPDCNGDYNDGSRAGVWLTTGQWQGYLTTVERRRLGVGGR